MAEQQVANHTGALAETRSEFRSLVAVLLLLLLLLRHLSVLLAVQLLDVTNRQLENVGFFQFRWATTLIIQID